MPVDDGATVTVTETVVGGRVDASMDPRCR
jgi:hypothetical protein